MKVVVIGAGAMGLAAAYRAAKNGHEVDVIEAAPEPGGMAGHFDFDGLSLERFYHFICKTDYPTFELMQELGLAHKIHWRRTTMGFFSNNRLYPWGDPIALLRFPLLGPIEKLRYGLFAFVCVRRNRWPAIEHESARSWIVRWCGASIYDRFWKPLFDHKFYEYADNISAAWIWTRIRRIGRSRSSIFQEELGYMEGGTITLVNALIDAIRAHGGRVHLGQPAARVTTENDKVTGVQTASRGDQPAHFYAADAVLCTAPTPLVSTLIPDLPADWKQRYDSIHNIGVICVIFKLARSVSPHFWINVSEPDIEIPGVIEFSNLRPIGRSRAIDTPESPASTPADRTLVPEKAEVTSADPTPANSPETTALNPTPAGPRPETAASQTRGDTIVYVPYYMPTTHPKFSWPDQALLDEAFACLQRINPALTPADILATKVARLRYGQPICEPCFAAKIPPIQTPIAGLHVADTCFYYPEDRGIAESVRLGSQMAESLDQP